MSGTANLRAAGVNYYGTEFALLAARWGIGFCPSFTCAEANAIAELIRVALGDPAAETFLDGHACTDDDPEDEHYQRGQELGA